LPYIIYEDFNPESAGECPLFDGSNTSGRCALFINDYNPSDIGSDYDKKLETDYAGIYSIEEIRDFVMCGYYTQGDGSPSYFQRLMENSYSMSDAEFGIETFVIGIYANDSSIYDTHSRLDSELYAENSEIKIRGLPGCKNLAACSDDPKTGIFALSQEAIDAYGLLDIACNNGAAGCD
jgi:hypothetical protein